MTLTHTSLAGLMALSLVSGASVKLPLVRKSSQVLDDQTSTNIYTNTDWTTVVSFGGQNFSLQVDTGSSDIWVLSTEMSASEQKQFPANHFFDPSKSKTFKMSAGQSFNISYDVGEIWGAGKVGTDNVAIGSASVNMPFGLATDVTQGGMVDTEYDGMLGLAFGAGNTQLPKPGPTFMEALQSQLDKPVFTFNLPNTASGQMLEFGHIDQSLYNGTLQAVMINNGTANAPAGWMSSLTYRIGGKNVSTTLNQALFDTGGLAASADPDSVRAYYKNIKGAKDTSSGQDDTAWAFPCSGSTLPDLTYDFVGTNGKTVSATVPGKFFNSTSTASDSSLCLGAFQGWGDQGSGTVGYAFFHSFFTVFDQSVPSVSFAPYPQKELDDQALSTTAAPSSGAATTAGNSGFKSLPTAAATHTGTVNNAIATASGSISGNAVAATAAPSTSDSAPGKSAANGLVVPSLAMTILAAVAGILVL